MTFTGYAGSDRLVWQNDRKVSGKIPSRTIVQPKTITVNLREGIWDLNDGCARIVDRNFWRRLEGRDWQLQCKTSIIKKESSKDENALQFF